MAEELPMPPRSIEVREYKGYYMWNKAEIEDFKDFKCRDDDIWVCSFPRSGTTLTQQMTYLISTLDFNKAKTVDLDDRFPTADVFSRSMPYFRGLKYLNSLPTSEPRFIKSHIHYELLPDELKAGKGKIIYITRNPKASVTSLYKVLNYMNNPPARSLREFVEKFLTGKDVYSCPWGAHVRQMWIQRNEPNVLFLQFEKLVRDRRSTIKRIADFLGRTLSEEQIDKIYDFTSLESMKNNDTVNLLYYEKIYQTDKSEGAFINKGEVSGWRNELPEDLIKRMDDYIQEELKETDIEFE